MRTQSPTDEQRARNADLTAKVQASIAEFEALPEIDKAVHRLDQKRSGIHGLSDFDSPLTKEQRDAIIDRFPEFVVLKAYRDARLGLTDLQSRYDSLADDRNDVIARNLRLNSEIAALQSHYDALLAERAGVSEAMVERMARAAHFGADGWDYESAFCRENDAHWEHWWNEDREMHVAIGKNILAALATPIPTPVDREAVRAEAFEEAAKMIDAEVERERRGNRGRIAFVLATIAAAIRSAAKTEASR